MFLSPKEIYIENKMKCNFCKYKKGEMFQNNRNGDKSYFEYCAKGHWEGSGLQNEDLEWKNCPDFKKQHSYES